MNASGLPITQLGSTINAHMSTAEKYAGKSEEHYKSAGLHLMEAKTRIATGEYDGKFGKFLTLECNGLSSSRAYELISIASGAKTVESIRGAKAASMKRSREAVRHVVDREIMDMTSGTTLQERRSAAIAEMAWLREMSGYEPYVEPQEEKLAYQIGTACQGVAVKELLYILNYLRCAERAPEKVTEG